VSRAPFGSVVVFRLDKIGDLLLSTPAISSVRRSLPNARLTLVASPYNHVVADGWDALDEVRVFDRRWSWREKTAFAGRIRAERYDLALVLSAMTDAYLLAFLSGARVRAGVVYSRRVIQRAFAPLLLTDRSVFHIDEAVKRRAAIPHEVEQMLEVVRAAGLAAEPGPLEVTIAAEDRKWAQALLHRHGLAGSLVGFHLSAGWLRDDVTGAAIRGLLDELLTAVPDRAVVLTYGEADRRAASALADCAGLGHEPDGGAGDEVRTGWGGRVLVAGDLSFGRWAALLSACHVVVTRDTGSLHLAAALGRPVVAVYEGPTFSHCSQQWAPWRVPCRIVKDAAWSTTRAEVVAGVLELLGSATQNEQREAKAMPRANILGGGQAFRPAGRLRGPGPAPGSCSAAARWFC